ncbi:hypothetical protein FOZ61_001277 [Perkinsus olseni]|uniref:Protein arginine methyltransferase 10 n=1 Tax=Perkinsus olseni TaxID=32597 RepID=A0A7J6LXB9_PEROL|nr:hypothetical protein FOZ61_001277 [Perkinsus olseni]
MIMAGLPEGYRPGLTLLLFASGLTVVIPNIDAQTFVNVSVKVGFDDEWPKLVEVPMPELNLSRDVLSISWEFPDGNPTQLGRTRRLDHPDTSGSKHTENWQLGAYQAPLSPPRNLTAHNIPVSRSLGVSHTSRRAASDYLPYFLSFDWALKSEHFGTRVPQANTTTKANHLRGGNKETLLVGIIGSGVNMDLIKRELGQDFNITTVLWHNPDPSEGYGCSTPLYHGCDFFYSLDDADAIYSDTPFSFYVTNVIIAMVKGGGVERVRFAVLKMFAYNARSGYEEGYIEDVQAASAFCRAIGCDVEYHAYSVDCTYTPLLFANDGLDAPPLLMGPVSEFPGRCPCELEDALCVHPTFGSGTLWMHPLYSKSRIGSPSPVSPSGLDDDMYMAHQASGTAVAMMGALKQEIPEVFKSNTELLAIIRESAVHPVVRTGDEGLTIHEDSALGFRIDAVTLLEKARTRRWAWLPDATHQQASILLYPPGIGQYEAILSAKSKDGGTLEYRFRLNVSWDEERPRSRSFGDGKIRLLQLIQTTLTTTAMAEDVDVVNFAEGLDDAALTVATTISRTLVLRTSLLTHVTISIDSSSPPWCHSAFSTNASTLNLRPFEHAYVRVIYHRTHHTRDDEGNCSLIICHGSCYESSSMSLPLIPPRMPPPAPLAPARQEHVVCSNTTGRYAHLPFPIDSTNSSAIDVLANARLVTQLEVYTQVEDYHLGDISSFADPVPLTRIQYAFDELEWIDFDWLLGDGVWVSNRGYISTRGARQWSAFALSEATSMEGIGCWNDECSISYSVANDSLLIIQWRRLTNTNLSFKMGLFRNGVVWADGPHPERGGGLHIRTSTGAVHSAVPSADGVSVMAPAFFLPSAIPLNASSPPNISAIIPLCSEGPGPRRPNTALVEVAHYRTEIAIRAPGTWWAVVEGEEVLYLGGMFNHSVSLTVVLYGISREEEAGLRLSGGGTSGMDTMELFKDGDVVGVPPVPPGTYKMHYAYLNRSMTLSTTIEVLGYDDVGIEEAASTLTIEMHPGSLFLSMWLTPPGRPGDCSKKRDTVVYHSNPAALQASPRIGGSEVENLVTISPSRLICPNCTLVPVYAKEDVVCSLTKDCIIHLDSANNDTCEAFAFYASPAPSCGHHHRHGAYLTSNRTLLRIPSRTIMSGGTYRICLCPVHQTSTHCVWPEDFIFAIGLVDMLGPILGEERSTPTLPPIAAGPQQVLDLSLTELFALWAPYEWHIPSGYHNQDWMVGQCNGTEGQARGYPPIMWWCLSDEHFGVEEVIVISPIIENQGHSFDYSICVDPDLTLNSSLSFYTRLNATLSTPPVYDQELRPADLEEKHSAQDSLAGLQCYRAEVSVEVYDQAVENTTLLYFYCPSITTCATNDGNTLLVNMTSSKLNTTWHVTNPRVINPLPHNPRWWASPPSAASSHEGRSTLIFGDGLMRKLLLMGKRELFLEIESENEQTVASKIIPYSWEESEGKLVLNATLLGGLTPNDSARLYVQWRGDDSASAAAESFNVTLGYLEVGPSRPPLRCISIGVELTNLTPPDGSWKHLIPALTDGLEAPTREAYQAQDDSNFERIALRKVSEAPASSSAATLQYCTVGLRCEVWIRSPHVSTWILVYLLTPTQDDAESTDFLQLAVYGSDGAIVASREVMVRGVRPEAAHTQINCTMGFQCNIPAPRTTAPLPSRSKLSLQEHTSSITQQCPPLLDNDDSSTSVKLNVTTRMFTVPSAFRGSQPGPYTLCLCIDFDGCTSSHHFTLFSGTLMVLGPDPLAEYPCTVVNTHAGLRCTFGPLVMEGIPPLTGVAIRTAFDHVNAESHCDNLLPEGFEATSVVECPSESPRALPVIDSRLRRQGKVAIELKIQPANGPSSSWLRAGVVLLDISPVTVVDAPAELYCVQPTVPGHNTVKASCPAVVDSAASTDGKQFIEIGLARGIDNCADLESQGGSKMVEILGTTKAENGTPLMSTATLTERVRYKERICICLYCSVDAGTPPAEWFTMDLGVSVTVVGFSQITGPSHVVSGSDYLPQGLVRVEGVDVWLWLNTTRLALYAAEADGATGVSLLGPIDVDMTTSVEGMGWSTLVFPALSLPSTTRAGIWSLCASYYGELLVGTSSMRGGVCTHITVCEVNVIEGPLRGRVHEESQIDVAGHYLPENHPMHIILISVDEGNPLPSDACQGEGLAEGSISPSQCNDDNTDPSDPTLCPQPSSVHTSELVSFVITPSAPGNFALCVRYLREPSLWAFAGTVEVFEDASVPGDDGTSTTEALVQVKPLVFTLLTEGRVLAGGWSTVRFRASVAPVELGRFFLGLVQSQMTKPCTDIVDQVENGPRYEEPHYTLIVHPRVAADHELCAEVPTRAEGLSYIGIIRVDPGIALLNVSRAYHGLPLSIYLFREITSRRVDVVLEPSSSLPACSQETAFIRMKSSQSTVNESIVQAHYPHEAADKSLLSGSVYRICATSRPVDESPREERAASFHGLGDFLVAKYITEYSAYESEDLAGTMTVTLSVAFIDLTRLPVVMFGFDGVCRALQLKAERYLAVTPTEVHPTENGLSYSVAPLRGNVTASSYTLCACTSSCLLPGAHFLPLGDVAVASPNSGAIRQREEEAITVPYLLLMLRLRGVHPSTITRSILLEAVERVFVYQDVTLEAVLEGSVVAVFSIPVSEGHDEPPLTSALVALERWRIQVTRPTSVLRTSLLGIGQVDTTFPIMMTSDNCAAVVFKGCEIYSRLVRGYLLPTPPGVEATTPEPQETPISLGEEAPVEDTDRDGADEALEQLALLLSACLIGGTSIISMLIYILPKVWRRFKKVLRKLKLDHRLLKSVTSNRAEFMGQTMVKLRTDPRRVCPTPESVLEVVIGNPTASSSASSNPPSRSDNEEPQAATIGRPSVEAEITGTALSQT